MIYFISIAVLFLASAARAEDIPAVMVRTHDGDTIVVNIPGVAYKLFSHELLIRIRGIDCPELHDKNPIVKKWGQEAADYTRLHLPSVGEPIVLKNVKWDKFGGRIDADVDAAGSDLSYQLLQLNLAKPFDGKHKKQKWKPIDCRYPETPASK